ncbi:MAG: T9SS type A sorting domain-containing protein [Bacteroidia bacterium]|nr:T9SS type A sorting domain-containing protein [Bacteroidia bacterium]
MRYFYFLTCLLFSFISFAQPVSWQTRGVGGGGALFFPTVNPANDNEFYITCDMSELFHSTDFGLNYEQVHFSKLQVFNNSTYEFTNDANIAYCTFNDGNTGYPVRTLDAGNSWQPLPGNPDPTESVYTLKADFYHPGRIVMGYYGMIYFSDNQGNTFSLVRTASNMGAGLRIAGVFFEGDNIYIGTNEGIIYSSNGGASFSLLPVTGMNANEVILGFAGAKQGNITRFFCIAADVSDVYNGLYPWDYWNLLKNVYSLDLSTNQWVPKMSGIDVSSDFCMYVGMAWNDINTVYLAGTNNDNNSPNILKTTNAGSDWSRVFLADNNQNITTGWSGFQGDRTWGYGETCFGVAVAPLNSDKVIFGDFGFVHVTDNGGDTWKQAYVSAMDQHPQGASTPKYQSYHSIGLENTTCWQVHWSDANTMFGCFSDIQGIRSVDAGLTWSFDYTGHSANSMYRIAELPDGTLIAGTSNIHDIYQSTRLTDAYLDASDSNGKIIYSSDKGKTWQNLKVFNHPVFWVVVDPNNPNTAYASVIHYGGGTGDGGIWKTTDLNNLSSSTWTKLPNPPRTEGHPASIVVLNDGKVVCTYSGRRATSGFTASSGVFIYDNNSWADVSHSGMQYWTKDLVIDPSDPSQNTWYACVFSGWGGAPNGLGGLYKTTNRGSSWSKLTGIQFDRVTSLSFNPLQNTQAFLTTETQGLWVSNTTNNALPVWNQVASYPFRQPERVFFNPFDMDKIWVTSFGNGMKTGSMTATGIEFPDTETASSFLIYPNPASHILFVDMLKERNGKSFTVNVLDNTGKVILSQNAADKNIQIPVSDISPGVYFIQIENEVIQWIKE